MSLRNIFLMTVVSAFCLIIITFAGAYSYFVPKVVGKGESINVVSGKVNLEVSNAQVIPINSLRPINDSSVDTSDEAFKTTFTVSRSNDSNLDICYGVFLTIDGIGDNLKSEYFKYRFKSNNTTIFGSFSPNIVEYDENGKAIISLIGNEYFSKTDNTSKEYELTLWLSYDLVNNQSEILIGEESTRTFSGHLTASGRNGVCN